MNQPDVITELKKIKDIDLVSYLLELGHSPVRVKNQNYWFLSPLRNENTASFKVDRTLNLWFDYGVGIGGSIIDFGIKYFDCSIGEFLKLIENNLAIHLPIKSNNNLQPKKTESSIKILAVKPIFSTAICNYLIKRMIPMKIANLFCKEVVFELDNKFYNCIGFENDSGGFELRNQWMKIATSPKEITTFNNHAKVVSVFEGFFDFLSFQVTHESLICKSNFVVLNSISLLERAKPFLEQHQEIELYLDQDEAGKRITSMAMSLNKRYHDKSDFYSQFKDVNAWHMSKIKKN